MRIFRFTSIAILLGCFSISASAQNLVEKSFGTQLFEPAIGTETLLTVEPASVPKHLGFSLGLMFNYQNKPLLLFIRKDLNSPKEEIILVQHQFTSDLTGAIGLRWKWLKAQIGFGLPVHLLITGNEVAQVEQQVQIASSFNATSIGDLRLQVKVMLLDQWNGLSIAFSPIVTFPTACMAARSGDSSNPCFEVGHYGGDPNLSFRPRVVFDYRLNDFLFAANIGWMVRQSSMVFDITMGDRLLYGVGAIYSPIKDFQLIAELFGQAGFSTTPVGGSALDIQPMEIDLAARYKMGNGLSATLGGGFGVITGIGSPHFRVLAGLNWAPDFTDTDKDGIQDDNDKCPTQAEDKDGFQDSDGCPELDNDSDGVIDISDKCPNEPEDKDTFKDEDGCPDPDNDGDGIEDRLDYCPFEPETKNGAKDEDGCPDGPDKDGDGIEDSKDKCPNEPETINGYQDDDGCPDRGNISVKDKEIILVKTIKFGKGKASAKIAARAITILQQLSSFLKASPQIKNVRIEGHGIDKNLWQLRAEQIRNYLIEQNIDSERLTTVGVEIKETPTTKKQQRRKQQDKGYIKFIILE